MRIENSCEFVRLSKGPGHKNHVPSQWKKISLKLQMLDFVCVYASAWHVSMTNQQFYAISLSAWDIFFVQIRLSVSLFG